MATATHRVCCCVVSLLAAATIAAQTPPRPKIGLALGGGGARGCAHVGVLRELERLRVPVDYVAGTSMGAVVGGLYASGMSPDEIERALTSIDWYDLMSDRTRFKDLSYRRKEDESRYLTEFEAGLRGARMVLPRGLKSGQKLRFLIQTYLIPVAGIRDFTKLPIPFKAVAADIETGDAVVLDHGDLAEAIRASMSIPGVYTPVELDGKLLVDGGIADNVPVDVVRAMGADIVIAVDVGSPLLNREQLGSLITVTSQVLTLLTRRNAQAQLAAADLVITPEVSAFGTMDFSNPRAMIAAGEREAERHRRRLEPLAVSPETYAELVAQRPEREDPKRDLDFIAVEGSRRVDYRIIRAHMLTKPARPLDPELLRHDVTRLYGLDDFEQVTFALRDYGGSRGLALTLKDKPWGPTYLRFGIHMEDDLQGESTYGFAVNATKTRLNRLGAEWRNDILLGSEHGFLTEFYQPLDFAGRFFIAPGMQTIRTRTGYWENGRHVADYGVLITGASFDAGMEFGPWGALRVGVSRARIHTSVETGSADLPSGRIDHGAFHAQMAIIRLDNPSIPHDGGSFGVEFYASRRSLGSDTDYSKFDAEAVKFVTVRSRQTYFIGGGGGTNLNTQIPAYDEFSLGGFLSLGGFALGQLHGQKYALVRSGAYYRVWNLSPEFGEGIYAGALYEVGNAWPAGVPARIRDIHRSATFVLGAQTVAGPILFGYGRAETGDGRIFLTIGKTF